jgi:hypothetical protein
VDGGEPDEQHVGVQGVADGAVLGDGAVVAAPLVPAVVSVT